MKETTSVKYFAKALLIAFACIAVNCFGRQLAVYYSLPGWLDTYGVFFAAYTLGPVSGAIVGVSTNFIFGLWEPKVAIFSAVSLFIGLSVGYMARKKYFDTLFHTMTVAGAVSVGSVVISAIINQLFNSGSTSNIWGDGVRDLLIESGWNKVAAAFVGEFYLEFPDKLLAALLLYLAVKIVRKLRKKGSGKAAKAAVSAAAAFALVFTAAAPLFSIDANAVQQSSNSYIRTVYNGTNGLACGHANAVAQTNDGVMWIGTYAGLYRYSGHEFVHMDSFDQIRNVNYLYVDSEGRLWVGTNDHGIVIVIDEKVANVITSKEGLPSDSIRSIVQSSSGEYYIGTAGGVVSLELKVGISVKGEVADVGYVNSISADKNGNTAAVSNDGTLFIIRDSKVVHKYGHKETGVELTCCNFASDGTLYAGSSDGKVLRYELMADSLKNLETVNCMGISRINSVCPEIDGQTWICADNGIGYVNSRGLFIKQESGEFNHSIENMLVDYQGNLWFTSLRLGLLRLSRSSFADIFADAGVQPSVVNTTAVSGGILYAGKDDGLTAIEIANRKPCETSLTQMFESVRVRRVMTDSKGNLWISTFGKGLVRYDRYGRITSFTEKFPEIGEWVRTTLELSDGSIAVSSSGGVFFIKDDKITATIPYDDEFGRAQVLCFEQTPDGTLYAGTDGNGIAVIKDKKLEKKLSRENTGLTSDVILRLVYDKDDESIYIVTSNSLCRLAQEKIGALSSFPYTNNYDVMLDNDGKMLVTGSAGIYVLDKHDLIEGKLTDYTILDSKSGLVGSLTANSWNSSDKDRNVYLSSDRGVFMMNLDNYLLSQRSFRIMVPEVKLDENPHRMERETDLSIERSVHKIEFFPEIINYSHDDPTVSYYLEGFESDWTNVRSSELMSVQYTNLEPGDYTFHLAVRDEKGALIEESSYKLHKEKAIYDNSWFKYYVIGVAAVFIGWLTWFITRQQLQRTLELQQTKLSMALQQVQMGNETILAIAKTVDAKDLRTSKHSQRVSEYSAMIAREYGFTEDEQENLRNAALLHDIGKIGIPDSVLNKPARLTDEEYAVMKTHVTRGAEILKDFTLIDHVVEGARYHHERYDGKGYPDGLKGEEIPLYGRIIAIADAFDAMTANRVYRKRQDFDYVMGELHKGRGTQFDPELLDIFLKLIDDKKIDIDALYKGEHQKGEEQA